MAGTNRRYYRGRAKEWSLGELSNKTEQITIVFNITTEGATHPQLAYYGYFSEAAWQYAVEAMRTCGWKGDDMTNLVGLDANEVDLVVDDETYNGKTKAKIQFVNEISAVNVKAPMGPEKVKLFAATMRDKIRGMDATAGVKSAAAPKPAAKPAPGPAVKDDIPF